MNPRTVAVDGSYFARSSFAVGDLRRGVVARLERLQREYEPRMLVVCWDDIASTPQRRQWSPAYKLERRQKKEEWEEREQYLEQLGSLKAHLPTLGIAQAQAEGWEGDDVMATVARTWPGPTVIATVDHDMLQLVSPRVAVDTGKGGVITPETIVKRTGLTAAQHLAVMSLAGDRGDGVEGVPKVAAGRATRIVSACPDVVELLAAGRGEEVYAAVAAADASMATWARRVVEAADVVALTHRLVSLYTVPLEVTPADPDPGRADLWLKQIGLNYDARGM